MSVRGKLRSLRTWFYGRVRVLCSWCDGVGGHYDGHDIQECKRCGGEGEL